MKSLPPCLWFMVFNLLGFVGVFLCAAFPHDWWPLALSLSFNAVALCFLVWQLSVWRDENREADREIAELRKMMRL